VLPVSVYIEGQSDLAVVARILSMAGCSIHAVYGRTGKSGMGAQMAAYNSAARFAPWFVLRDLDNDEPCAPILVQRMLPHPSRWMRFRVAVREVESWLLADADRVSDYFRIAKRLVPGDPEGLADPKQALVNLVRRSRVRAIREDVVPEEGVSSPVGPGYVSRVSEFARDYWRPEIARQSSLSLDKCINRLGELLEYVGPGPVEGQ